MFKNHLAAVTCVATLWTAVAAAQSTPKAAITAPNVVVTNGPPGAAQIVTLRPGVDLDGFVKEFGLKPSFRYRHALNGFAAPIDPDTIGRLKRDSRVLGVEAQGQVALVGQTVPTGVLRVGLTNFSVPNMQLSLILT